MSILSENLTLLRKKHGYTQDILAEKVFVTRQAVSKWERGDSMPDLDTLIALSEIFSVSVDELVKNKLNIENIALKTNTITNSKELKAVHKRETAKSMLIWAIGLLSVYALICGIIQTATVFVVPQIWLIWFTLPIVPPLIFAIRFRYIIGKAYFMFFINMPFISGIIFECIILLNNPYGAWIAFLLIPIYYTIALIIAFNYRKNHGKLKGDIKIT